MNLSLSFLYGNHNQLHNVLTIII